MQFQHFHNHQLGMAAEEARVASGFDVVDNTRLQNASDASNALMLMIF